MKMKNTILFKDKLEALKNKIPEVLHLETGVNFSESPKAFDLVLTTHFSSEADLDLYRNHPDHKKIVGLIKEIVSEVVVVDYIV